MRILFIVMTLIMCAVGWAVLWMDVSPHLGVEPQSAFYWAGLIIGAGSLGWFAGENLPLVKS